MMTVTGNDSFPMNLLHHPAFQSLALPLLLAALGMVVLAGVPRWVSSRHASSVGHWAPAGALLGLWLPMVLLSGLEWPAAARTQKLPWIVLAAGVVVLLESVRNPPGETAKPHLAWRANAAVWLLACVWLQGGVADGLGGWLGAGLAALAGSVVLALLAAGRSGAVTAAVFVVAGVALAVLAALGGSLLMAQLALIMACSMLVPGVWVWLGPRAGQPLPAALLQPFGLAGVAVGWIWMLSAPGPTPVSVAQLGLLVLALGVPWLWPHLRLRSRWLARQVRWAPLWAALLAALPAALALGLPFAVAPWVAPCEPAAGCGGADPDSLYYAPR